MPPLKTNPLTAQALREAKIIVIQTSGIEVPLVTVITMHYGVKVPKDQMITIPKQKTSDAIQIKSADFINAQKPTDGRRLLVLQEANTGNPSSNILYDNDYFAGFPDVEFILCYGVSPNAVEFAKDCPGNILGIILKNGIHSGDAIFNVLDRFSGVNRSAFSQQELIAQHPPGAILTSPKGPKIQNPKNEDPKAKDPGYTEPDVPDDDIDSNLPTETGDEGETASVPKPGTGDRPGQTHKAAVQPKPKAPKTAGSLFGQLNNNNDFGKSTGGLGGNVNVQHDIANAPKIRGGGEDEGEEPEEHPI